MTVSRRMKACCRSSVRRAAGLLKHMQNKKSQKGGPHHARIHRLSVIDIRAAHFFFLLPQIFSREAGTQVVLGRQEALVMPAGVRHLGDELRPPVGVGGAAGLHGARARARAHGVQALAQQDAAAVHLVGVIERLEDVAAGGEPARPSGDSSSPMSARLRPKPRRLGVGARPATAVSGANSATRSCNRSMKRAKPRSERQMLRRATIGANPSVSGRDMYCPLSLSKEKKKDANHTDK